LWVDFTEVSGRNRWLNVKSGFKEGNTTYVQTFMCYTLVRKRTDLHYTQILLGHSSPKTTEIYTPVAVNSFRRIKNPLDLK